MSFLKTPSIVIFSTCFCWLILDFTLTAFGLGPWSIFTPATGTAHEAYHHTLKPNFHGNARFGNAFYRLCTNKYGFKIACDDMDKAVAKQYDVAFIGDSFTEAVGMAYEHSFVGMYAAANPTKSVVNLGVSSYAPTLYFKKIQHLLDEGFHFDHVIVAIDISDIQDEALYYKFITDSYEEFTSASSPDPSQSHIVKAPFVNNEQSDVLRQSFFAKEHLEYTWYINLLLDAHMRPKLELEIFDTFTERSAWVRDENIHGYGDVGVKGGIERAVASMERLKKLLDSHKISMSVFVYPWPSQLIFDKPDHRGVTLWREFCERNHCTHFIDANSYFYDQVTALGLENTINKYYIRGDFHFNEDGNEALYNIIKKALTPPE